MVYYESRTYNLVGGDIFILDGILLVKKIMLVSKTSCFVNF